MISLKKILNITKKNNIKNTINNASDLVLTTNKKKKNSSPNKKKGLFMKIIIIYCLAFICITNVWSLWILKTTGYDASDIVDAINLVHGGELLICIVKKIIDSPDNDIGMKSGKNPDDMRFNYPDEEPVLDAEVIDGVEYSCEENIGDDNA